MALLILIVSLVSSVVSSTPVNYGTTAASTTPAGAWDDGGGRLGDGESLR